MIYPAGHEVPSNISLALASLGERTGLNLAGPVFTDLVYDYGRADSDTETVLWRASLEDLQTIADLEIVILPRQVSQGVPVDVLIQDTISEGAWE